MPASPGERRTVVWEDRPHSQGHPGRGPTLAGPNRLSPSGRKRLWHLTDFRSAGLRFLKSPLRAFIGSFKTQPSQLSPSPIGLYGTGGGSSGASQISRESLRTVSESERGGAGSFWGRGLLCLRLPGSLPFILQIPLTRPSHLKTASGLYSVSDTEVQNSVERPKAFESFREGKSSGRPIGRQTRIGRGK